MTDDDKERRTVYGRLEEAVEACARFEEAEGVLTDWVVVYAAQSYDEDGDSPAQIGRLTPQGKGAPYHRVMGLLDYALTLCRGEVVNAQRP
jgi:hypothetical protein